MAPGDASDETSRGDDLSVADAAGLLRMSLRTVARWVAEGRLPSHVNAAGERRISRAEIDALLQRLYGDEPV